MSDNLPDDADDIRSMLDEIGAIKEILRDLSRQLLRIERRVKASFQSNARLSADQGAGRKERSLNEQSAGQVIEKLKEKVSKGEQVETQLKQYSVKPDLQIIARLLGMTNTKLPPKDELIRRISTRLRQSVSVITGIRDREKRRE
jgi:hypothetical protein